MIKTLVGNIFESNAQTLVNTVNCVGVMGKGLALEFKKRFPEMYQDYVERCKAGKVQLGKPYLYFGLFSPWILNFPTKDHWRSVSRLSDIVEGLEYLEAHYREWGITSLAVPALGCSNGQLDWRVVGPTLYRHLSRLEIPVELYAPLGTPTDQLQNSFLTESAQPRQEHPSPSAGFTVKPAWVALVEILNRIQLEPYHWPVGRTVFQKIAYFATESGLPTELLYTRGSYGPFSYEVKQLITRLVNNGLLQEEQLGKMFAYKPGPAFTDAAKSFTADLNQWNKTIEGITDLFLRMRTEEAEVAATVHFAARLLKRETNLPVSEKAVLEAVKQWKQKRRPPLEEQKISETIRNLNMLGWIKVEPSSDLPLPEDAFLQI